MQISEIGSEEGEEGERRAGGGEQQSSIIFHYFWLTTVITVETHCSANAYNIDSVYLLN